MNLRTRILSLRDCCDLDINGWNVVRFENEFKVCTTRAVAAEDPDADGCEFYDRDEVDDLTDLVLTTPPAWMQ